MEISGFDSLLRSLATTPSRRSAMHLLVGSAIGTVLASPASTTQAKKKKKVTLCHEG